jgi:hypothetical protein
VIAQTTGHKSMTVLCRYIRKGSLVSGRGGIAPPGSRRTGRDSLLSSGSHRPTLGG